MIRRGTDRLATAVTFAVVGLIVAVLAGKPEALILTAPWAVLLVFGMPWTAERPRSAEVEVSGDRFLVGDIIDVRTVIKAHRGTVNVTPKPGDGFWPDSLGSQFASASARHDVVDEGTTHFINRLRAMQWGTHDVGRVAVEFTSPYGLFRWSMEAGQSKLVRIHPNQHELRNLLAPWLVRRIAGAHESNAIGRGVEYADIRPFTNGDSLRDINWKASARSPEIWVSQRHPDRATEVVLMLDSFIESGHDVRTVFGLAVEGAVALAESHLGVNDRVGLVELGGTVRWVSPGTGQHQLQRMSDFLLSTGLHGHDAQRDLSVLMTRALPPRSFVVALTPLLDQRFIDALLLVAGSGHDLAVVECDPVRPPNEDDDLSHLVARFWDAERQIVRDRLTDHGIAVATWRRGDHLDLTLKELLGRRRRLVMGGRR